MEAAQHPRIVPPTALRALSHKSAEIPSIALGATVSAALQSLADINTDALAVMDGERLAGVFSEHDFACFMRNGGDMNHPVSAAMSACLQFANPDDTVEHWLSETASHGMRVLPVLDGKRLLGLLSRADLLAESDAHHRRVYEAMDLDQRIMFKRGTYSC